MGACVSNSKGKLDHHNDQTQAINRVSTISARREERLLKRNETGVRWWGKEQFTPIEELASEKQLDPTDDAVWRHFLIRQFHAQESMKQRSAEQQKLNKVRSRATSKSTTTNTSYDRGRSDADRLVSASRDSHTFGRGSASMRGSNATRKRKYGPPTWESTSGVIRPFISSTFRDFSDERDMVTNYAFPRIEQYCTERGLRFQPLDLRWGVTSEQSVGGEVVRICLEEIDRCRPYFVAFLGFRNGWCMPYNEGKKASKKDSSVTLLRDTLEKGAASFPWVRDMFDRSVTEIEILHGALNLPIDAIQDQRIFFYFRDVQSLEALSNANKTSMVELGYAEKQLYSLKTRIIEAGFPVKWFSEPDELSDLLETDLIECVQSDYPVRPNHAEIQDHAIYAESLKRCYVPDMFSNTVLDAFCDKETHESKRGNIVLVQGTKGVGCSAFLANWVAQYGLGSNQFGGAMETLTVIIDRYIGINRDSTSPPLLLRSMMAELQQKLPELAIYELPHDEKEIIRVFASWIRIASSLVHELIIVLDALHNVRNRLGWPLLLWLPKVLPVNVTLICCAWRDTVPYKQLAALPHIKTMEVPELDTDRCLQVTKQLLMMYGKQLSTRQLQKVENATITRNPLFLMTFLNQLRGLGVYELVDQTMEELLSAQSVTDLFGLVLSGLERSLEKFSPLLVQNSMGLLLIARDGLLERELSGALEHALGVSRSTNNFPVVELASLLLRLDGPVVNQRGLRRMANAQFEEAIWKRFFSGEFTSDYRLSPSVLSYHRFLAAHFHSMKPSMRKAETLTYHLSYIWRIETDEKQAELDRNALVAHLTSLPILSFLFTRGMYQELISCWDRLEAAANHGKRTKMSYAARTYIGLLQSRYHQMETNTSTTPEAWLGLVEQYEAVGGFLIYTKWLHGLEPIVDVPLSIIEKHCPSAHEQEELLLMRKAQLMISHRRFEEAISVFERALSIVEAAREKMDNKDGSSTELMVRSCNLRRALADAMKEDPARAEEALKLYRSVIDDLIKTVGRKDEAVANAEHNLADLYLRLKRPEKAIRLFQEALDAAQLALGRQNPEVATILSGYASCYVQLDQFSEAMKMYKEAFAIKSEVLGSSHAALSVVMTNISNLLLKLNKPAEAVEWLNRLKDLVGVSVEQQRANWMLLGNAYERNRDVKQALQAYERVWKLNESPTLSVPIPDSVDILRKITSLSLRISDYTKAHFYATKGLSVCGYTVDGATLTMTAKETTSWSVHPFVHALGVSYYEQKHYESALSLFQREIALMQTEDESSLNYSLLSAAMLAGGYAGMHGDDVDAARELFMGAVALYEEAGHEACKKDAVEATEVLEHLATEESEEETDEEALTESDQDN